MVERRVEAPEVQVRFLPITWVWVKGLNLGNWQGGAGHHKMQRMPSWPAKVSTQPASVPRWFQNKFKLTVAVILAAVVVRVGFYVAFRMMAQHFQGGTAALPESFPDDVPLYAGYRLSEANSNEFSTDPEDFQISFETSASQAGVESFYATSLPANGWKISDTGPCNPPGFRQISANKDDRVLVVVYGRAQGTTIVSIAQMHVVLVRER